MYGDVPDGTSLAYQSFHVFLQSHAPTGAWLRALDDACPVSNGMGLEPV